MQVQFCFGKTDSKQKLRHHLTVGH